MCFFLTMSIHVELEIRLMGSKKGDIEEFVNCVFGVCCSFATKFRNAGFVLVKLGVLLGVGLLFFRKPVDLGKGCCLE